MGRSHRSVMRVVGPTRAEWSSETLAQRREEESGAKEKGERGAKRREEKSVGPRTEDAKTSLVWCRALCRARSNLRGLLRELRVHSWRLLTDSRSYSRHPIILFFFLRWRRKKR